MRSIEDFVKFPRDPENLLSAIIISKFFRSTNNTNMSDLKKNNHVMFLMLGTREV